MLKEKSMMSEYLSALRKYPQLKHPEVVDLFKDLERGGTCADHARRKLIECNLRLVISIAKKFKNYNVPIEDLIQEGNIGLMKSIERFDWKRGFRFSTYATYWVKQSIGQHILKKKRTIRLPAHAATLQRKMMQASEEYRSTNDGHEPSQDDLIQLTGASQTVARAMMHVGRECLSLDEPAKWGPSTGRDSEHRIQDKIEDVRPGSNPFDNVSEKEILDVVKHMLSELSPKEAAILRLRFGLVEDCIDAEQYPITDDELKEVARGCGLK